MTRARALRAYIAFIGVVTVAVIAVMALEISLMPRSGLVATASTGLLFTALCWAASRQQLYFRDSSSISMGTTPQIAALLVLPYPVAIVAIGLAKFLSELTIRIQGHRPWRAVVVNLGGALLANVAAGGAFHMLYGNDFIWDQQLRALLALPALAAMTVAYHFVDAFVVVGAICLSRNSKPWLVFRAMFTGVLLPHVSLVFVGVVFAVLWHFSPGLSLLVAVPVFFSVRSFEAVARLRKETVEAVLKIAESIDYRDTGTAEHSQRIADLTRRLSLALGLAAEQVTDVVLGSRVHDLGKIGISNEILLKVGPLTEQEREVMQEHPAIGAKILSSYSAFQGSVAIVRHHHERWDGKGYPDGLRGDDIPIGSRIVAVVDAFDAMTADRPYRQGMSVSAAVDRLKDGMGTQFDPKICAAFIQMLIEDGIYTPPEAVPHLHLVTDRPSERRSIV